MSVNIIVPFKIKSHCKTEDCYRYRRYSSGFCTLHHRQFLRHSKTTNNKKSDFCKVDNCIYWAEKLGLCENHYTLHKGYHQRSEYQKRYYNETIKKKRDQESLEDKIRRKIQQKKYCLKKFGLTEETYGDLIEKQNNQCAICKLPPGPLWDTLAIDHCHKTGQVRGLLCNRCNRALGLLKESRENIYAALQYVIQGGLRNG